MNCLLVEDDFIIALHLQMLIEAGGGTVVGPFASAADALAALNSHTIDGAVLDFSLLGSGNSVPVADELVERKCPFVFVTGQSGGLLIPRRFDDALRLIKPFRDEELISIVRAFHKRSEPSE